MGLYVTQADLETWMGEDLVVQLSNTDPTETTVDADAVTDAIAAAEADVHGAVGVRHSLPLPTPYPVIVLKLAKRLARFYLYDKHPALMPEGVEKDYERCRTDLRAIARGETDLGLDTDGGAAATGDGPRVAVRSGSESRRYGRDDFGGF